MRADEEAKPDGRDRVLSDVDGVVFDLMGRQDPSERGFAGWMRKNKGIGFDPNTLGNLRVTGENRALLLEFLRVPNVYLEWVDVVPGAVEALGGLVAAGFNLRFVTSITEEPQQYVAKDAALQHHFRGIDFETLTIPSGEKHFQMGGYFIDDRADTCARVIRTGDRRGVFLFKQPWNFAYGPDGGFWKDEARWHSAQFTFNGHNSRGDRIGDPGVWDPSRSYRVPFVLRTDDWRLIASEITRDADGFDG